MTLYIDGDAFPNMLKPIILKATEKNKLNTFVVSNKKVNIGKSKQITYLIVKEGANEADNRIVELIKDKKPHVFETFGMTETVSHIAVRKLNNFSSQDSNRYFETLPEQRWYFSGCITLIRDYFCNIHVKKSNELIFLRL